MSDVVDELSSFQASKGVDDAMIDFTQEIVVMSMEEVRVPNTSNSSYSNSNLAKPYPGPSYSERRARPQKEAALKCPRCDSTNTKFCYYNDYSLSKPRYFCKTCRKYWTNGGTLANIPVGDGSRKNKTSSSSSSSYSSVAKTTFPKVSELLHFDATRNTNASVSTTTTTTTTNNTALALELLKASVTSTGSFMPIPIPPPDSNSVYTHMPEFKIPSLSFSLDGMGSGNGGRILFPFEELKTNTSATHDDDPPHIGQNKDQNCDSNGFWNGMMDEAAHD